MPDQPRRPLFSGRSSSSLQPRPGYVHSAVHSSRRRNDLGAVTHGGSHLYGSRYRAGGGAPNSRRDHIVGRYS